MVWAQSTAQPPESSPPPTPGAQHEQPHDPALAGDWPAWLRRFLPTLLGGRRNEPLPISIHRKRILTLPTRRGLLFGVMLLVLLLGGLNYANNPALLLTFMLGALALVSLLHAYRNLLRVEVSALRGGAVFAGQPLHLELVLRNPERRPRFAIGLGRGDGAPVTDLTSSGEATLAVEIPTTRRGWKTTGRLRLFTEYPLGLFVAWTWIDPAPRVLVYPRPEPNPPSAPPASGHGEGHQVFGGDEELVGFRNYQPGDPPRQIAWRASARVDRLLTREIATPRSREQVYDWQELGALDTEARISRLTAWILQSAAEDIAFTLRLPGVQLGPGSGTAHLHRCLRELALFRLPTRPARQPGDKPARSGSPP